jgi:nucleoside-diphosphate-sugar epimerase
MSKVLITGAAGFIGRHLYRSLTDAGQSPVAALRTPAGFAEELVLGDLAGRPDLSAAMTGIDAVVHLAGRAHVMHETAADEERAYRRVNLDATLHLARAAAAAGARRFVFLSSIKVNGEATATQPFRETDRPAPTDAYARSKWAAEQALMQAAAETGLEIVVIRPPLVYGPGVKANFLALMRLVDRGLPLPFGLIRNSRSLVNLDNLASLIRSALTHPAAVGETFLVSDQQDLSTAELVRLIAQGLGRPARLLSVPPPLLATAFKLIRREAAYARIAGSLRVDSSKASRLLGWRPMQPPSEALRDTARWYRERGSATEDDVFLST